MMNRLKHNQIVYIPKNNPIILYKKLGADMQSPYQFFKYVIGKIYSVEKFNENIHRECVKGRIYSIPKNQLIKWYGIRFFEVCVWGKCILESQNKVGSEHLKIIRELELKEFVEYMSSMQAYLYCKKIKDVKEIRDKIIDSADAYLYCKNVKDRKEIRDRINKSFTAYLYCYLVKDIKEIRDRIVDSYNAYCYCKNIKDRKDMRDKITDSYHVYLYCKHIKNKKK